MKTNLCCRKIKKSPLDASKWQPDPCLKFSVAPQNSLRALQKKNSSCLDLPQRKIYSPSMCGSLEKFLHLFSLMFSTINSPAPVISMILIGTIRASKYHIWNLHPRATTLPFSVIFVFVIIQFRLANAGINSWISGH